MDFERLYTSKQQESIVDPIEIFRYLPKPAGINDLYISQAEVLKTWFQNRDQRDTVIKLHTGGGKTLVGLLIAQSVLNETGEPVLYVSSNKQLVDQTLQKSQEYSISAVHYEEGFGDFHAVNSSIWVCNYHTW
ncbi:MAG: DEAD/DEAH box helicase family protein [Chloroflexaceae bacterium]|nr:DEAD/DEAH box helicase family protein [Chloroflexaceae bacterium]